MAQHTTQQTRWPNGTVVVYHGSVTPWHGHHFEAWPCDCENEHCGQTRYQLDDLITEEAVLLHVRPGSFSPVSELRSVT
ncbi:hypothetical protein CDO52_12890 [Nocardiopsis gilva YIM 90087]|uniref:Uncharacterized protein n=1 Tax=Nocardiopsis gilva YIM 90087 TaxID=1235441 RepID=A0A223S622_9ACTN|nr:hypothetical protein [Nocardiopsis gilva]ASU83565.1 hypothetical protein CDO52_12890 [Nocardiopsis gilva YIM 90087]